LQKNESQSAGFNGYYREIQVVQKHEKQNAFLKNENSKTKNKKRF